MRKQYLRQQIILTGAAEMLSMYADQVKDYGPEVENTDTGPAREALAQDITKAGDDLAVIADFLQEVANDA